MSSAGVQEGGPAGETGAGAEGTVMEGTVVEGVVMEEVVTAGTGRGDTVVGEWPVAECGQTGPDGQSAQVFTAEARIGELSEDDAEPAARTFDGTRGEGAEDSTDAEPGAAPDGPSDVSASAGRPGTAQRGWDDGLIARRAPGEQAGEDPRPVTRDGTEADAGEWPGGSAEGPAAGAPPPEQSAAGTGGATPGEARRDAAPARAADAAAPAGEIGDGTLTRRLGALRELIGLSRTRLESRVLAEPVRVLDEAGARGRLSRAYTTVAIAGATGSGKSSLFNALAGRVLSEVGTRRPTTAQPVACTWEAEREGGADGLLDRLGIAPVVRRRVRDAELHGLVLVDLPDHDSLADGHREQVDRLLGLVDAVVWVVDPEKYADAVLHERYLRPLAGYAEVTFVVLNQTDRLPGDAADAVLDDLRRLLDEDGMALGEHGEPGARVLSTSALTGEGIGELREELGAFAAAREAPARRLAADLDGAAERLRPAYADPELTRRSGLTERAREDFEERLASAVGAAAAGQAAERAWLRHAERSCGTPWAQLARWYDVRRQGRTRGASGPAAPSASGGALPSVIPSAVASAEPPQLAAQRVARPVLAQAVRELAARAVTGLPEAWRKTVRDAAWRGAEGLPEALDEVVDEAARSRQAARSGAARGVATRGRAAGQRAADRAHTPGATGVPGAPGAAPAGGVPFGGEPPPPARMPRPPWWTAATVGQGLLLALQVLGVVWLVGAAAGAYHGALWVPAALVLGGALGGPMLAWGCRAAARGPARAYGQEEERRLRRLASGCGRSRVLEPVAAELLRYREVREQFVIAAGDAEV
ncbi:50S ribosome-binding GTPase [Streptomyces sp. N2-109]|uniref:50S ribosome-binding GTPase n=1 Tax=Streptomyces gossypii TaxID=2883101 RepID=A0ABT2JRK2_9ACTN|nr:GTPase [Streptomyces gossypii]MCT2590518.1 50S ribosome-binding GTPase [Streptomyces gossypii]